MHFHLPQETVHPAKDGSAQSDLAKINDLIFAKGAPLGSDTYFEIRKIAAKYSNGAVTPQPVKWSYDPKDWDTSETSEGIRHAAIEECAKLVEPKGPRPCDCDRCYCHNQGDAEAVAAWDADAANAKAIRALSAGAVEGGKQP